MSRLKTTFEELKKQGKKALIPYITAGDPTLKSTVPILHALVAAGADVIELGMPFSDPMAEGPVIQEAHERALLNGATLQHVFSMVETFRKKDANTPLVLMGYLNPIEVMGYETFAREAARVGVDGVLIVDMPPEEGDIFSQQLKKHGIDSIYLISPTTGKERLGLINALGGGYHYYVSLKGVTGASQLNTKEVEKHLKELQPLLTLPLCIGFGIQDAHSAKTLAAMGDGIVIGTALIKKIHQGGADEAKILSNLQEFIHTIRVAL